MKRDPMKRGWKVGGTTKDEGWKVITKDKIIGNEDDGFESQHICTVYDESLAHYVVGLHNSFLDRVKK